MAGLGDPKVPPHASCPSLWDHLTRSLNPLPHALTPSSYTGVPGQLPGRPEPAAPRQDLRPGGGAAAAGDQEGLVDLQSCCVLANTTMSPSVLTLPSPSVLISPSPQPQLFLQQYLQGAGLTLQ